MVSTVIPVQPFDLVIFGATGDLAKRKILPSLFRRMAVHQVPDGARIIGAARSQMSQDDFRKLAEDSLKEFVSPKLRDPALVAQFLNALDYVHVDAGGTDGWAQLAGKLDENPDHIRAFYLSVAPALRADRGEAGQRRGRHAQKPHRRGKAAGQGPRLRAGLNAQLSNTSPRIRYTVSTITSARRRSRT